MPCSNRIGDRLANQRAQHVLHAVVERDERHEDADREHRARYGIAHGRDTHERRARSVSADGAPHKRAADSQPTITQRRTARKQQAARDESPVAAIEVARGALERPTTSNCSTGSTNASANTERRDKRSPTSAPRPRSCKRGDSRLSISRARETCARRASVARAQTRRARTACSTPASSSAACTENMPNQAR